MPLRLRRGNDSERQSITPQEGELIYVTDTKSLWIGDGITPGGFKASGAIPDELDDLSDIDLSVAPQIGQVLKWNGTAFVASNDIDTDTIGVGVIEGSNYRVNIVGEDSTIIVNSDNNTFTGTLFGDVIGDVTGDVVGSVFGDNSSVIIDSINNRIFSSEITTSQIFTTNNTLSITNPNSVTDFRIESVNTRSRQNFYVLPPDDTTDLSTYTGNYATINFGYNDVPNGPTVRSTIRGSDSDIRITHDLNEGFLTDETKYFTAKDGFFGIGTYDPTVKLDVRGKIKAESAIIPGVFADATARDTAIGTPVEGMTIFLSSTQKMQVYVSDTGLAAGGAANGTADWVNMY